MKIAWDGAWLKRNSASEESGLAKIAKPIAQRDAGNAE